MAERTADTSPGRGDDRAPVLRVGSFDFGRTAFAITPYLLIAALAAVVGRAALVLGIYALAALLLVCYVFQRRDVTA